MNIRIDLSPEVKDTEVVIRCNKIDDEILKLQNLIFSGNKEKARIVFYKDETEFYLPVEDVLFFETSGAEVWAHTANDEFTVKYKLYELEDMLPGSYMRISKSAILNTAKVYSITRNLTAASMVEFYKTDKTVFVSRSYYKELRDRMATRAGN